MDLRFNHPANFMIAGPTKSGKSTLVKNLLIFRHILFKNIARSVILVYKRDQEIYDSLRKLNLVDHFIDINTHSISSIRDKIKYYKKHDNNGNFGTIIILDDLLAELSSEFQTLFTVDSHHFSASVVMISQKLHYQNEIYRTIALNCEYSFLMKNPRNSSIKHLASQIAPYNINFPVESYLRATKHPYSYLLYDASQDAPDVTRLRSHIFPFEFPMKVYVKN